MFLVIGNPAPPVTAKGRVATIEEAPVSTHRRSHVKAHALAREAEKEARIELDLERMRARWLQYKLDGCMPFFFVANIARDGRMPPDISRRKNVA